MNTNNISTSSYVALAGIIVSVLAHYNIVIGKDSIVAIIAGVISLVGVINQLFVHSAGIKAGSIRQK